MKNILVPIEEHDSIGAVLETAWRFAQLFGGRIEGIALGPDTGDLIAADFAIAGSIFDEKTRRELVEHARRVFEDFMRAHNVPATAAGVSGPSYGWAGGDMSTDSGIGAYGRIADIVVIGRPGAGRGDPRRATLESVLFESGRPILIAPRKAPQRVGETVLIHWNRSTETARTVGFAMPILKRARRIVVLTVTGALSPGPSAEALAKSLQRHDLAVDVMNIDSGSRPAGKVVLEQCAANGVDLLVKGGYTQSRLRQMIFGGATSEILASAELPVFMAH
ncbi:MAG: universal stress protein [Hyphomicrobiales bacterium]|nr:universal stress protein [Hyphomicrobiales bacterium]